MQGFWQKLAPGLQQGRSTTRVAAHIMPNSLDAGFLTKAWQQGRSTTCVAKQNWGRAITFTPQDILRFLPPQHHVESQPTFPRPDWPQAWETPPWDGNGAASSSESSLAIPDLSSWAKPSSCTSPRPLPSQTSGCTSSASCWPVSVQSTSRWTSPPAAHWPAARATLHMLGRGCWSPDWPTPHVRIWSCASWPGGCRPSPGLQLEVRPARTWSMSLFVSATTSWRRASCSWPDLIGLWRRCSWSAPGRTWQILGRTWSISRSMRSSYGCTLASMAFPWRRLGRPGAGSPGRCRRRRRLHLTRSQDCAAWTWLQVAIGWHCERWAPCNCAMRELLLKPCTCNDNLCSEHACRWACHWHVKTKNLQIVHVYSLSMGMTETAQCAQLRLSFTCIMVKFQSAWQYTKSPDPWISLSGITSLLVDHCSNYKNTCHM